jgi:diacylglycerol kinase (ATP)
MKKYKLIANPHAGRGRARKIIAETIGLLNARGVAYDLAVTAGPGDAETIAARAFEQDEWNAVISIGGDGTLNEIVQKAIFTSMPLGVIPAGSGNDFSKVLNTPAKLGDIVDTVLAGRTKVIDAARMNNRYFINSVGIGFDAAVNYNTRSVSWPTNGLAVYFMAFLKTLRRYRPLPMKITVGDETIERGLFLVSVGNGTTCGGGFKLTPHAKIDDGLLDVTMITPLSLPQLFRHLPKVFQGTIDRTQYAIMRRAVTLTVESAHPLPLHVDGEVYALEGNVCRISIVPKALTMIGNW